MAQQTAVEWLYDKLFFAGYAVNPEWKEQAKEMEKEHLMMAFNDGKVNSILKKRNSEEYYNETYNNKNK
jgi:hypothetical protein